MEDQNLSALQPIYNYAFPNREAPQSWPQILISWPADLRLSPEHPAAFDQRVNQPVRGLHAIALVGNAKPNSV
jgi:hypothetical protein